MFRKQSRMLSEPEFLILNTLRVKNSANQRDLAAVTELSLGTTNSTLRRLQDRQYLNNLTITQSGLDALGPYKVDNAIIMAAGMSTRFAPISYERPKGTLTVRGEVLIERIIRQLQEAGITDIVVVVGYMKEQFLYLEDAFNVKIVVSEWYSERNNHSSLYLVRERLANTYILTADNYFTENLFAPYEYCGYYSAVYQEEYDQEYFLATGSKDRITKVTCGGKDGWIMYGAAYFDKKFSAAFATILEDTFDLPETKSKLWEDLYRDNVKRLDLKIRRYPSGVIFEFDFLEELRSFDEDFVTNIDSSILSNIEDKLHCKQGEISNVTPIAEGLTNLSFSFNVGDERYVYRHPGVATEGLLDRAVEEEVEKIAYKLGLDKTFIHLDPQTGWKLSRFIETTEHFDYGNPKHVQRAMEAIHKLHDSGISVSSSFDLHEKTNEIKEKMGRSAHLQFSDFEELDQRAFRLNKLAHDNGARQVLCHNDFYDPNILVCNDELSLIDWEYSGMSDYASDLGTFICCSDYTFDEAKQVLKEYFGRDLTPVELAHCVAYVSLASYYWFVWALLKEIKGEGVGQYLYLWYRYAKKYGERAEKLFESLQQ